MFIPSKIEQLIIDNKLTKKSFCEKVSISVQGLDNILKGADLGSSKLTGSPKMLAIRSAI